MPKKFIVSENDLRKIIESTTAVHEIKSAFIAEDHEGNDILKLQFTDNDTSIIPISGLCESCIRADILTGILMQATNRKQFASLMEQVDELSSLISARLKEIYECNEDEEDEEEDEDEEDGESDSDFGDWAAWLASKK